MSTVRTPGQALARLADLDRQQWLDLRRAGIGSSDAAAVCGVDPWRSPYAVWAEKVAPEWPDDDNSAMEWGRILEPAIADKFQAATTLTVHTPTSMYVHPDHHWMRASPDRELLDENHTTRAILEIKTTGRRDAWEDGPPDPVQIQVQHQLEVLGVTEAWIAVLIGGNDYRHYHTARDDELVGYLLDIETDFWRRVQEHDPPPVDGSAATSAAVRALHSRVHVGAERLLDAEAVALVAELRATRALRADLERDETELENRLKVLLADAEIGVTEDGERLVTWKQVTSNRIDTAELRAAYPQIAEQLTTATTSRRFVLQKETRTQ